MDRDIRGTNRYKEVEGQYRALFEPGFGAISSASNPDVSPDGTRVAFTGGMMTALEGSPETRVCIADLANGEIVATTSGPNNDRFPRWSPDGSRLAFLSDRIEKGRFLLYLLKDGAMGEPVATPEVAGTVEYFSWSPDGRKILLGFAGQGADLAGGQGSGKHREHDDEIPSWMPIVDSGVGEHHWRRLAVYDVASGELRVVSRPGLNVWEAGWAGNSNAAAIVSEHPGEGAWYTAPLATIDLETGNDRILYRSEWQLGLPAASPSGATVAVVEAVCSDRLVVAGDLLLVDAASGETRCIDTHGADVSALVWRGEDCVVFGGLRGLHSVIGECDSRSGTARDRYETDEGLAIYFPDPSGIALAPEGRVVVVRDSYTRFPELTLIENGEARTIHSFKHEGAEYLREIAGTLEAVRWNAPDGLEIEGYLIRPEGEGPFPLITVVHGGPVSAYRNRWPADHRVSLAPLLVGRGYAILYPNPRGSVGRGQEFARAVYGDMGGEDTGDILSGIDAMVERGIADPQRLGVTGGSYGGFMTSWLITQTDRFAAAVSVAPCTDWYSFHWTSNIPYFDEIFLQDDPTAPNGKYYERSPIMFVRNVRTPTLNIAGGQDKCTPASQAVEFHNGLLENGVESQLVIYPEEGHGVRAMPAAIDYATRVIDWFERHL